MVFRVIFVVTRSTAPPNGELLGDVLYVNAPDGYRNIVYKVKHMMGLVSWLLMIAYMGEYCLMMLAPDDSIDERIMFDDDIDGYELASYSARCSARVRCQSTYFEFVLCVHMFSFFGIRVSKP